MVLSGIEPATYGASHDRSNHYSTSSLLKERLKSNKFIAQIKELKAIFQSEF